MTNNELFTTKPDQYSVFMAKPQYYVPQNKLFQQYNSLDSFVLDKMGPNGNGAKAGPIPPVGQRIWKRLSQTCVFKRQTSLSTNRVKFKSQIVNTEPVYIRGNRIGHENGYNEKPTNTFLTGSTWIRVKNGARYRCKSKMINTNLVRLQNKYSPLTSIGRSDTNTTINCIKAVKDPQTNCVKPRSLPKSSPPGLSSHKSLSNKNSSPILRVCVWNAQSLKQKTQTVKDFREEFDLDIFLFTETWLKTDDMLEIGELESQGEYYYIGTPRESRPGGGVGAIIKSGIKATKKKSLVTKTFEHMELEVQIDTKRITFILIYRPEPSCKNKYTISEFFEEFTDFLTHYQTYQHETIITGDFNFHVNKPDDYKAIQFNSTLEMFDLVQHVKSPTHREGNTLDLVITHRENNIGECAVGDLLSDHNCIHFNIDVKMRKNPKKTISFRNTRKMNIPNFKKSVMQHFSSDIPHPDRSIYLNQLVRLYLSSANIFNQYAPVETKLVTLRKPTPFVNADIKNFKTARRKAERRWRRTRLVKDWLDFKEKRNACNEHLNQLKSDDLRSKIRKTKGNAKAMFKVLNSSLNRKQEMPLPIHNNESDLANEFNNFFDEKIKHIRSKLDSTASSFSADTETVVPNQLSHFEALTESEVKKLITSMPVKHCQLDPLPTWLLIECLDEFLPIITKIVNLSLTQGEMPLELKHALVKPLLKKPSLDHIKKNYRPVSNLPFLSKIIESAVIKQYVDHLSTNGLNDNRQSAYKQYHSTESLLTKIHNDIMLNLSKGEVTMLVLLDLSAAFDTIDHDILIKRLERKYGVKGTALSWFKSYMSNRSQSVIINNNISSKLPLHFGVPQGSKLGPILFNSYIAPVSEVAKRNHIEDQKYADDEQLILSFKPNSTCQASAKQKMEKCIDEIRNFLHNNKLCNNGEKTELLLIGAPQQLIKLNATSICIDNVDIKALDQAKNLGVIFDKNMDTEKQINKMCKNAYFNIRNISKLTKTLDKETIKTAVNALVTPHLDYGNGLLYGIKSSLINRLQVAQNSAVRLIEKLKKHDSVCHSRQQLHWLPIPARIQYKLLTTTWKALNNQAPEYITQLINERQQQSYQVRSNNQLRLIVPPSLNKNNFEDRALSYSAPELWNKLPNVVKEAHSLPSFKKRLKTHLCTKFYRK